MQHLGAGMQEFMDWGKWKTLKIGQRYISQSETTKKKHASRLSFVDQEQETLLDTPYREISKSLKKKSFTDNCIAASKTARAETRTESKSDDGIDYKSLYFKELKRNNNRKRKIEEIYDDDDYDFKKETDSKRFKKNDENGDELAVKGESHGLYYIEDNVCYKRCEEHAAKKDGFYIFRGGKYYKRLDE